MAQPAVARDAVCALRREIARIEGRLAETLATPSAGGPVTCAEQMVLRRVGMAAQRHGFIETGAQRLDAALGGGLPGAGLIEIHGRETRAAGTIAGFALGLTARLGAGRPEAPLLWIGTSEIFREAGWPYLHGLGSRYGIRPEGLMIVAVPHLVDALWVAEEAASLTAFAAVILELRGNPAKLDLVATRRLHHRAKQSGRPVLLLRQGAEPEPTAAPVRLLVAAADAGQRHTLAGPLPRSIGPPGFLVSLSKSRDGAAGEFRLEWNADERVFHDRGGKRNAIARKSAAADPSDLVSLSPHGADPQTALRPVVAHAIGDG